MDKENIENQSQAALSSVSGPSVGHTVEVPSSSLQEAGGPGQEIEDRSGLEEAEEAGPKSRLKITIRSWSGVAVWKWLANDDTCGICRVAFDGCCPDCKFAGDDCSLVSSILITYDDDHQQYFFQVWGARVHPLFQHSLHREVAGDAADPASVPYLQTRLEIQRVNFRTRIQNQRKT